MNFVYFDNAATTAMDQQVVDVMVEVMRSTYGNASSVHQKGTKSRASIEVARSEISEILQIKPSELFFTSGATESINTVLYGMVKSLDVKHIITSKLEHLAVLETIARVQKEFKVKVSFVDFDQQGNIDLDHLYELLQGNEKTAVCLMHVNNELGNILPLESVAKICQENKVLFFSDTVQSIGKIPLNLDQIPLDFAVGSAHKFHGPKGVGFLYINSRNKISPYIHGGAQEINMRAGTENIAGIVGMAKAFELAHIDIDSNKFYISNLKNYLIEKVKEKIPTAIFNGDPQGIHTILNIGLPKSKHNKMVIFNLDVKGFAVSGGSACSSGVMNISHVIKAIGNAEDIIPVRVSLSKYNTINEIDRFVNVLKKY